eukprot:1296966-Karenia_brevis.AAC.1
MLTGPWASTTKDKEHQAVLAPVSRPQEKIVNGERYKHQEIMIDSGAAENVANATEFGGACNPITESK